MGYFPQPIFVPRKVDSHIVQRARRVPDSAGIIVCDQDDQDVPTRLGWWCEEKPEFFSSPHGHGFQYWCSATMQILLFASSHYIDTEGFSAFLVIRKFFSLFFYERPKDWFSRLTAVVLQVCDSPSPAGAPQQQELSTLVPRVIMFNERMFNQDLTDFSPQMFYAFVLIKEAAGKAMGETVDSRPSFFEPATTNQVNRIPFNATTHISTVSDKVKNEPSLQQEEVDALLTSKYNNSPGDNTSKDPSYEGSPPTLLETHVSPRRTQRQTQLDTTRMHKENRRDARAGHGLQEAVQRLLQAHTPRTEIQSPLLERMAGSKPQMPFRSLGSDSSDSGQSNLAFRTPTRSVESWWCRRKG
ncbi:hypothetical protein BC835DRAFT_1422743 [Cytidiella melzeri]|nr:hypothetical protein BC835DRAFT_1422743 [Cytidiella melzeri]